jgi:hypothetical protein
MGLYRDVPWVDDGASTISDMSDGGDLAVDWYTDSPLSLDDLTEEPEDAGLLRRVPQVGWLQWHRTMKAYLGGAYWFAPNLAGINAASNRSLQGCGRHLWRRALALPESEMFVPDHLMDMADEHNDLFLPRGIRRQYRQEEDDIPESWEQLWWLEREVAPPLLGLCDGLALPDSIAVGVLELLGGQ